MSTGNDPREEEEVMAREAGEADSATQAFEALRGEVAALRQTVQVLPDRWEVVWKASPPPDYAPSLGAINQALTQVSTRLAAVEAKPALGLKAGVLEQEAARAATGQAKQVEGAVQALRQATEAVEQSRRASRRWLAVVGSGALVTGLLLSPVVSSLLPSGWASRVAALIMQRDRWQAGGALMAADSPVDWLALLDAGQLARANEGALKECREAAARTKKPQRCVITVRAPEP
jgi:hypothetical protein